MQIRPVKESDNKSLAKIIRTTFGEFDAPQKGTVYSDPTTDNLYELFLTPKSVLWVAELNGELLGCCGIYPTEGLPSGYAELVKFYLAKEARGRGVGRQLMEKTVDVAGEMGYTALYLESMPEFSTAVSIYKKQGFVEIDGPLGDSGHPACSIWMLKTLA